MRVHALIPAAGMGRRMGAPLNKQYLQLAGRPVLAHTLSRFEQHPRVDSMVVISPAAELDFCRGAVVDRYAFAKVTAVVAGGAERQDSVRQGLEALAGAADHDLVLIHDGVRPLLDGETIGRLIDAALEHDACLAGVPAKDTLKEVADGLVVATPERSRMWQAQTPQAFRLGLVREAHRRAAAAGHRATDDAALVEWCGHPVHMVMGSYRNIKITTPEDLAVAEAWLASGEEGGNTMRIGHGYDVHRLVAGRKLILGGVEIPWELGLLGHSDADVLLHALCDAILGALGAGDIGRHFPDSDPAYQGIDSRRLLERVVALARAQGCLLSNCDVTVVAQRPRLAPYIAAMANNIAVSCGVDVSRVNVKATTTETLGFEGRGEGISAHAVVLLATPR